MSDAPASNATPESTLKITRIVWAALLLGLVVFGGILATQHGFDAEQTEPAMIGPLRAAAVVLGALILGTPIGYFTRLQVYKRGWQGYAVKPEAYFLGNLILFSILEAITFIGLLLGTFVGDQGPCWGLAFIAFLTLAINFPNGKPMEASQPRL